MHAGERLKGGLKRAMRGMVTGPARSSSGRSLILTYHSVGRRDHEMNVSPAAFAEQMHWLADHFAVIPLSRAAEAFEGVAITFDDGYRDNLTEAAPVLDALRFPATVFVVPDRLGSVLDHDSPNDPHARLLSWEELRTLVHGGWAVGGHTMTHCRLSHCDEKTQRREIAGCKVVLDRELGVCVESFAYPYGSALDYTEVSTRLVRESGYAFGVSNRFGTNTSSLDRWALRRIWIDRTDTLESFRAKVEGRLDRLALFDTAVGIRARKAVNRLLRSA